MRIPPPTDALFLCDGAPVPRQLANEPWTHREEIRSSGPRPELNLQLDTLDTKLHGVVSGVANDLLYIACCCLAADQRIDRGSKQIDIHRRKWRRHFTMVLPVSSPTLWARPDVTAALREALGFATEDDWSFAFVKLPPATVRQTLFGKETDRVLRGNPDCVVLFSGGMDSLCATVEAIADRGQRPLALSFRSANQVAHGQADLVRAVRQRFPDWLLPHLAFSSQRRGGPEPDPSQRSRAFVLAALGCAVAESLGIETVLLADNGYVSINPPISGELAGALASRGTHPTLLRLVNRLVSLLFSQPIMLINPLADQTRAEALETLKRHNCQDLISSTLTCGKFRSPRQSGAVPHCGTCSQCVDRRFAVIRAGLEDVDPADRYVVDLFTQDLVGGEALKVAPMYVRFAQEAGQLTPEGIVTATPHLTACLDDASGDVHRDALELGHLLWRHSREVTAVVAEMIGRYPRELATGVLPDRSLLRLVMGAASVPASGTEPVTLRADDRDWTGDAPSMELKGTCWHVVFNGEKAVVRDRKGFAYISRLLKEPDQEIGASLLASGGIGEVTSMAEVAEAGLTVGSTFDEVLTVEDENYLRTHIDFLRAERHKTKDLERQSDIDREIEAVETHIAKTRGRGGRPRTFADNDERARASVKRAIDRALAELAVHLPALHEHLRDSIHTGRRVTYAPRPPVHWDIAA